MHPTKTVNKSIATLLATCLVAALLLAPVPALAQSPDGPAATSAQSFEGFTDLLWDYVGAVWSSLTGASTTDTGETDTDTSSEPPTSTTDDDTNSISPAADPLGVA